MVKGRGDREGSARRRRSLAVRGADPAADASNRVARARWGNGLGAIFVFVRLDLNSPRRQDCFRTA